MFTLELTECEARDLLSLLNLSPDLPLSLTSFRERLTDLSEYATAVPPPASEMDEFAVPMETSEDTQNEAQHTQGKLYAWCVSRQSDDSQLLYE